MKKNKKTALKISGWSYPERRVKRNPLKSIEFNNRDINNKDIPELGLIHAEMNNPSSNYAPISEEDLKESGMIGWILGHIHKPYSIDYTDFFVLNPGSPQPLNPGETGDHQVCEVVIKSKNNYSIYNYQLSSLKYQNIKINISQMEYIEELSSIISRHLRTKINSDQNPTHIPDLIIVRLVLSGNTEFSKEIEFEKENIIRDLELNIEGSKVIIDHIENKTDPPIDIKKLAAGNSQAALVAKYLLKIKNNKEKSLPEDLLKKIEKKLIKAYQANAYQPLRSENKVYPPTREKIYQIMEKQARNLLNILLKQKDDLSDKK